MLAEGRCSELDKTLVDREKMMSAMNNNVEELKQKNLVLSKKANEAEDWKQGYKIMKDKVSCSYYERYFLF